MFAGDERFENFDLRYYPNDSLANYCSEEERKNLTPVMLKATPRIVMSKNLKYCKSYADRFAERGCESLLLSRPTGLGKTYLSACIARQVTDSGFSVLYETAQQIFRDYELQKFGMSQLENQNLTTIYKICDLLIIDDLGTEMVTQFIISALYDIVNLRLVENRTTIISTNVVPEMIASKYSPQI